MSVISLDAQQLESLNQEIVALDNSLLQNYLPELQQELSAIKGNVQGDEIHNIINTILSQFEGVKTSLTSDLPKLEQFLEQQIKSYTQTEEELETELTAVMNRMTILSDRVNGVTIQSGPTGTDGSTAYETTDASANANTSNGENNGSGLGDKVASGAVTGAVLGGVGMATGVATTMLVGTKLGAAIGSVAPGVGTLIGAAAGAAIGAAAPVVINAGGKLLELGGKAITGLGSWLDSIY